MAKKQNREQDTIPARLPGNALGGIFEFPLLGRGYARHRTSPGRLYLGCRWAQDDRLPAGLWTDHPGACRPARQPARCEAIDNGVLFAHTHTLEIDVAERIVRMCPGWTKCALPIQAPKPPCTHCALPGLIPTGKWWSSLKGQYHGFHDYVLFSTAYTAYGSTGSSRSPIPCKTHPASRLHCAIWSSCCPTMTSKPWTRPCEPAGVKSLPSLSSRSPAI
jgi:hypothetical protein